MGQQHSLQHQSKHSSFLRGSQDGHCQQNPQVQVWGRQQDLGEKLGRIQKKPERGVLNGRTTVTRASCAAEKQAARDCLCEYNYEGRGSPAGSVGCCSLLESDNDLHFLDDLGTKFKTLAKICSPPRPSSPLIPQCTVPPDVDKVDRRAGPPLETKPPSIHGKSPDQNVSVSQPSTSVMGLNSTSTSIVHGQTTTSVIGFNGAPPNSCIHVLEFIFNINRQNISAFDKQKICMWL
ncbi:desmoglein-2-like protein [Anoplopoma fimbria]|uniref:desmoglein-2-like protein n=1 Tax=Anoplopoma fimbria TaxID=229290 RepID=UPI0023EDA56E|nr:desmoglein-2-like protein [Anoplopoma fimbria]